MSHPRPYDEHLLPPIPSPEDWRKWGQRLPMMSWIENQVLSAFLSGNVTKAEQLMRRWGPVWQDLFHMLRPGSAEWIRQYRLQRAVADGSTHS